MDIIAYQRRRKLLLVATACVIIQQEEEQNKKRSVWSKKWLLKRSSYSHINLTNELACEDISDFRNYLRMDVDVYNELLRLVTPLIRKQDTPMRKAITPDERLSATLRYLATGRSYEDLKYSCGISKQALSLIIPETCRAIIYVLKNFLKFPQNEDDWRKIADDFNIKWQFPHCLGAADGKHVRIQQPQNSGSFYYNYKGYFSIVLFAIVNANYEFIFVDAGTNGRVSDGGVIDQTKFYDKLKSNQLKIPLPECLPGTNTRLLDYVFIGDDAFSLRTDFIKPFGHKELSDDEKIFNYRLSRARRIVENVFGILSNRFRIYKTEINLELKHIDLVVHATCYLHNFLRKKSSNYMSSSSINNRNVLPSVANANQSSINIQDDLNAHQYANLAKKTRENFMEYFNHEGAVTWQWDHLNN